MDIQAAIGLSHRLNSNIMIAIIFIFCYGWRLKSLYDVKGFI